MVEYDFLLVGDKSCTMYLGSSGELIDISQPTTNYPINITITLDNGKKVTKEIRMGNALREGKRIELKATQKLPVTQLPLKYNLLSDFQYNELHWDVSRLEEFKKIYQGSERTILLYGPSDAESSILIVTSEGEIVEPLVHGSTMLLKVSWIDVKVNASHNTQRLTGKMLVQK